MLVFVLSTFPVIFIILSDLPKSTISLSLSLYIYIYIYVLVFKGHNEDTQTRELGRNKYITITGQIC